METPIAMETESIAGTFGETKQPGTVLAAPQAPDVGIPFVKSVKYYIDRKRTQLLAGTVQPGDTVYIEIVFSEGMELVVADDTSARPILYYKIGRKLTRFRIAPFSVKNKDLTSGTMKPLKTKAVYFGVYTIQEEDTGKFTVAVGKKSADRDGNTLAAFYTHKEKIQIEIPVVPEPVVTEPTQPDVPVEPEPGEYSFTIPNGETYPGYNPSPTLQEILNTHPSAKLPFFEEAVRMMEVVDWVYRRVWDLYPDWRTNPASLDKMVAARNAVRAQFGTGKRIWYELTRIYFNLPYGYIGRDAPPHSMYWLSTEHLRLKLEYPDESDQELLNRFNKGKKNVVGLVNPNN